MLKSFLQDTAPSPRNSEANQPLLEGNDDQQLVEHRQIPEGIERWYMDPPIQMAGVPRVQE